MWIKDKYLQWLTYSGNRNYPRPYLRPYEYNYCYYIKYWVSGIKRYYICG